MAVLFKTELRREADGPEYEETDRRMMEIVSKMPGFISIKPYTAEDGERISLVRFESKESLEAWTSHPEHRKAQQRAREFFYDSYWVQVCEVVREYDWSRNTAQTVRSKGSLQG